MATLKVAIFCRSIQQFKNDGIYAIFIVTKSFSYRIYKICRRSNQVTAYENTLLFFTFHRKCSCRKRFSTYSDILSANCPESATFFFGVISVSAQPNNILLIKTPPKIKLSFTYKVIIYKVFRGTHSTFIISKISSSG